jgi:hypothetical protein
LGVFGAAVAKPAATVASSKESVSIRFLVIASKVLSRRYPIGTAWRNLIYE